MTSHFGYLLLLITQNFLSGPVRFQITSVDCSVICPGHMDEIRPQILVLLTMALMIIWAKLTLGKLFFVGLLMTCLRSNDPAGNTQMRVYAV